MLDKTLGTFNKLVEAIEARMPHARASIETDTANEYGLVDETSVENIAPVLAREFLRCAWCPKFGYIVPGLKIMDTAFFSKQPFNSNRNDQASSPTVPPIPLFY